MYITLRNIRCDRGIGAEELAGILGLNTKAAYYKKETGTVKFTLVEAKKIADFFCMQIEDIFFTNEVSQ